MLEIIVKGHVLYVFMGVFAVIGILSKGIVNMATKRMLRASGNMSKSNHPLMRLVKAKFEHACMVSDTVENVAVFVDKYLYEYRVLGLRLHTWQRLEKIAAGICLLLGAGGAGLLWLRSGMSDEVLRTGAFGAVLAIFVYLVHLTTDEGYRIQAVRNYMVDYLENVCRRRYERSYQKDTRAQAPDLSARQTGTVHTAEAERRPGAVPEVPVLTEQTPVQKEEPVRVIAQEPAAADEMLETAVQAKAAVRQEERKEPEKPAVDKDLRIRQILEEFMA